MQEVIKDNMNRTIGFLREQGGIIRICDKENRTLGTYNPRTDMTYTANGQVFGRGDQTMRLLTN